MKTYFLILALLISVGVSYICNCSDKNELKLASDSSGWIETDKYYFQNYNPSGIIKLVMSEDGTCFYTYHGDYYFRKWEMASGNLLSEKYIPIVEPVEYIYSIDFTNDFNIALVSFKNRLIKYDMLQDTIIKTIIPPLPTGVKEDWEHFPELISAYFTPDKKKYILEYGEETHDINLLETFWLGYTAIYNSQTDKMERYLDKEYYPFGSIYSKNQKYSASSGSITFHGWDHGINYDSYETIARCNGIILDSSISSDFSYKIYLTSFSNKNDMLAGYIENLNKYYFWDPGTGDILKEKELNEPFINGDDEYQSVGGGVFSNDDRFFYGITNVNKKNSHYDGDSYLNVLHLASGEIIRTIHLPDHSYKTNIITSPVSNDFIVINNYSQPLLFKFNFWDNDIFAVFKADLIKAFVGDTIHFTDFSEGNIVSYSWDFGDSTYSSEKNPSHVYNKTGTYNVKLVVYDGKNYDTLIRTDYIHITSKINADFEISYEKNEIENNISFINKSSGDIISYEWDFGDRNKSTDKNPIHIYPFKGDYTVTLVVANSIFKDTIQKKLKILNPAIEGFKIGFENEIISNEVDTWGYSYFWTGEQGIECPDNSLIVRAAKFRCDRPTLEIIYEKDHIIKMDKDGNILWNIAIAEDLRYYKPRLFPSDDNGFFICYSALTKDYPKEYSIKVLKYDKNGKLQYKNIYYNISENADISIMSFFDGGFLLAANINGNASVMKCNKDGEEELLISYPEYICSVIYKDKYETYLLPLKRKNDNNFVLMKIGEIGEIISTIEYPIDISIWNNRLVETNDSYIISFGKNAAIFDKKDTTKFYSTNNPNNLFICYDMNKISNDEVAFVGDMNYKIGLSIYNKKQNIFYDNIFPNRYGYLRSIVRTKDNGLFIVGTYHYNDSVSKVCLLKLNIPTPINVKETSISNENNYNLSLFPNPTDNNVTISYNLASDCNVRLSLFNQFGEEIAIIINTNESAGQHNINYSFGNSALPNGIYFVQLKAGNSIITEKIVLVE